MRCWSSLIWPMSETIYFAYGSNLDPRQMALRCPGSQAKGAAVLKGWRFLINQRGYATIMEDPTAEVHGQVWMLPPEDEAALDEYESVDEGNYQKAVLKVHQDGGEVNSMVYIDHRLKPGMPQPDYLQGILHGAAHFELPMNYQEELARWAG